MKRYRWLGTLAKLNEATVDDRVLAYGVGMEALRTALRWKTPLSVKSPAAITGPVPHRALPLPLMMNIAGQGIEVGDEVGLIDSIALDGRNIIAGGTIMVPSEGLWARNLLAGRKQPVALAVTDGDVVPVDVVRHPMKRLFRPTFATYMVHHSWKVKYATLVNEAPWEWGSSYIRLAEPVEQVVSR